MFRRRFCQPSISAQQNTSNSFSTEIYELPRHRFFEWAYSTRHKFSLAEKILNTIRRQMATSITVMPLLCKLIHLAWHVNSVVQRVHSQVGHLVSFFSNNMFSAFWHYKSQPVEKELPVYSQYDVFLSCNLSMEHVQTQGLIIQFWHAANNCGNSLNYFRSFSGLSGQQPIVR